MQDMQHSLQRAAFSLDDDEAAKLTTPPARRIDGPVIIEVRDLEKTFRIPHRAGTLSERARHPLQRAESRELRALRDVSFDVREGEFFGIVGRNGSGKSTLLKILASIYRADAGRIRMSGRLAPFIELGVGFNPDLTARENVALNGVMLGLTRREAAGKLDSVLDFAELREFVDLKLKNYSSGMMVRLAFSVMVEADADMMLVDEVLAVGDAAFGQKCMDVFRDKRKAGKTVVLVTHDMAAVQSFCDRAMLLHDGHLRFDGDPDEAVLRYFRLNFGGRGGDRATMMPAEPRARLVDAWLEDPAGRRVENIPQGETIGFNLVVEAREDIEAPLFTVQVLNVDDVPVFGFTRRLLDDERPGRIAAGGRVRVTGTLDNPLTPGRYSVHGSMARNETPGDVALPEVRLLDFVVQGRDPIPGMVFVQTALQAIVEEPA